MIVLLKKKQKDVKSRLQNLPLPSFSQSILSLKLIHYPLNNTCAQSTTYSRFVSIVTLIYLFIYILWLVAFINDQSHRKRKANLIN